MCSGRSEECKKDWNNIIFKKHFSYIIIHFLEWALLYSQVADFAFLRTSLDGSASSVLASLRLRYRVVSLIINGM